MSPMSEAKKRANKKWNDANMKERYDRVQLVLPKGRKAEIQAEAERREQSVNSFINGLIDAALSPGVPGADVPSMDEAGRDTTEGPGRFPYFPDGEYTSQPIVGTSPMQDEESPPSERPEQLSPDDKM